MSYIPHPKLKEAEILMYRGRYDEAREIIESSTETQEINEIECELLKSRILIQSQKYQEGLAIAEWIINSRNTGNCDSLVIDAMIIKLNALAGMNKIAQGFKLNEEIRNILEKEEVKNQYLAANYRNRLENIQGDLYIKKGMFRNALECLSRGLEISADVKDELAMAISLASISNVHIQVGEIDKALASCSKCLSIFEKLTCEQGIADSYRMLAVIHWRTGRCDKALEYNHRALKIYRELGGHETELSWIYNNTGAIHVVNGDVFIALDFYRKYLFIVERKGDKSSIAHGLMNLGYVYHWMGEFEKAREHYKKALDVLNSIDTEVNTDSQISSIIYPYINLLIEENSIAEAKSYLSKLEAINSRSYDKLVHLRYKMSRGKILKSSKRFLDKAEAMKIFKEISQEEKVVKLSLTTDAKLNLCELLFDELKYTGNEEVVNEIKGLIDRLLILAEEQNSFKLLCETYLLKSKLALIELDLNTARKMLSLAQEVAENKGLNKLAMKISDGHDNLLDQAVRWKNFIDEEVSLEDRIDIAGFEEMVVSMIRKRVKVENRFPKPVHEEPVLLLVVNEAGISTFSRVFSEIDQNYQLISGFLSAINSVLHDIFSESGPVERIKYRDYTVIMKRDDSLLFCYAFKGKSYYPCKKVQKFIDILRSKEQIWTSLKTNYPNGKPPLFDMIDPIVDHVFKTTR
ncbi:MAG: tetratricopeptide repeat protein [Candidatus Hodarchaeales archaeon]